MAKPKVTQMSVMEFFILALVGRVQLSSVYELQKKAFLQPGGIRPALRHLEQLGLLVRAKSGVRRRRQLELTPKGEKLLEKNWRECMRDYAEPESVFRAACVVLLVGDSQTAAAYLERQGRVRKSLAVERKAETGLLELVVHSPLSMYLWMRTLTDHHRQDAEGQSFLLLSQFLKENPKRIGPEGR